MILRNVGLLLALLAAPLLAGPAVVQGQTADHAATPQLPRLGLQGTGPAASPLQRPVNLNVTDMELGKILTEISTQAALGLVYETGLIPAGRRLTIRMDSIAAGVALRRVLVGTDLDYSAVSDRQVVIFRRPATKSSATRRAEQQIGTIVGRVMEAGTETPIVGAQLLVDGIGRAITNPEGRYQITGVKPGKHTVSVVMIGYRGGTQEVEVGDGATVVVNFTLEAAPTQLSELVVTATGEERRLVEIGNYITVLNADSIAQREPVTSVADLLEGRVPGLVVQRSSGAPGDPTRIRIRGVSSPSLSNDPIIVVDGIRVYSEQSGPRGGNLAQGANATYAAPSPLDYIDPNSIATIQVIRGPSAATMYGQDAANGVIVITTKRGQPGNTRWNVSMDHGQTRMAHPFPDRYIRWGRVTTDSRRVHCPLNGYVAGKEYNGRCMPDDSLVVFQALNDPDLTIVGKGQTSAYTLGVSGGSGALTYNLGATYRDEQGMVVLSRYEVDRFRSNHGTTPPAWMHRPQYLKQWSVNSRINMDLGRSVSVALTSRMARTEQQRSELERGFNRFASIYVDPETGEYFEPGDSPSGLRISDANSRFYERATARSTQFTNGVSLNWRAIPSLLTIDAAAGVDVINRADDVYLPAGFDLSSSFTADGDLRRGQGTSIVSTFKIDARSQIPLGLGFRLALNGGFNLTPQSTEDITMRAERLPEGVEMISIAAGGITGRESREARSTYGWYIAPSINHRRMWLTTGVRLDGGSSFGTRVKLPTFPKLDFSYLISDEPYFPESLGSVFSNLRLRVAYGHAGRQPGPVDRLRLYSAPASRGVAGRQEEIVTLNTLGNTELRPERSREFEGGFEADLFDYRFSVSFNSYVKTTEDALMLVPLAPSVYGEFSQMQNIGVIRNAGFEMTFDAEPVRSDLVTWRLGFNLGQNRNEVVELGPGVEPFYQEYQTVAGADFGFIANGIRVAPGFPLFGRWMNPVLGYADADGNGVLEEHEVIYGDTAVYVGTTLPEFSGGIHSSLSLLRGKLTVSVGMLFDTGVTQWNESGGGREFSRAWNHPAASLTEQLARMNRATYARAETVNSLRFNTLSVRWQAPGSWARRLGVNALDFALQGTNLALWTNYSGLDPNVNSAVRGDNLMDNGVLPEPRRWQLRVSANY